MDTFLTAGPAMTAHWGTGNTASLALPVIGYFVTETTYDEDASPETVVTAAVCLDGGVVLAANDEDILALQNVEAFLGVWPDGREPSRS